MILEELVEASFKFSDKLDLIKSEFTLELKSFIFSNKHIEDSKRMFGRYDNRKQ